MVRRASLPDANDMLDANTVFFRQSIGGGQPAAKPISLPSRSHAEIIFTLARLGLHGSVRLREGQSDARELKVRLDARLAAIAEKANHLARSRTSDERRISDVAGLLQHWLVHGKPRREPRQVETAEKKTD